jgi:hypothetical protein
MIDLIKHKHGASHYGEADGNEIIMKMIRFSFHSLSHSLTIILVVVVLLAVVDIEYEEINA